MNFIVYNKKGEILRTGSCHESVFQLQVQQRDEALMEGTANDNTQYICDGIVTDYTNEELLAKSNIPYGYEWQMPDRSLVQVLSDEEIIAEKARVARSRRDLLLSGSDWTQSSDQPQERKAAWLLYRQGLRDITSQFEFPASIVWPNPPI